MQYEDRWRIIKRIGEGGQGEVFLVSDEQKETKSNEPAALNVAGLISALRAALATTSPIRATPDLEEQVRESIVGIVNNENPIPTNLGALKILHSPNEARNFQDAEERLKRELEAMQQADHPNLLKIIDYNLDEKWFVSKYYPKGTLTKNSDCFTGQVQRTLTAIRPIVHGVVCLHGEKFVHRDIKPDNIFVEEEGQLVLGDFGLVHFTDRDRTRLSGTVENVGSRDWMPPWAAGRRPEQVKPNFDVFSLGKTIWSMVSKKPILPYWYHRKEENDLQRMFPTKPEMEFLNRLLDKCIVENEEDCWDDLSWLLVRIDDTLRALELGADPIRDVMRPCRVCGLGEYRPITDFGDQHRTRITNFGLTPHGNARFKIFICVYCGHVQLFLGNEDAPPAWNEA